MIMEAGSHGGVAVLDFCRAGRRAVVLVEGDPARSFAYSFGGGLIDAVLDPFEEPGFQLICRDVFGQFRQAGARRFVPDPVVTVLD